MAKQIRERWDLGGTQMETLLTEVARFKGESLWQDAWRRLKANRASWWALVFLAVFGSVSILAPVLPLPSPTAIDLQIEPQPPVAPWTELGNDGYRREYWDLNALDEGLVSLRQSVFGDWQFSNWLGTDAKGRDILSRIIWGSRTSILVAIAATICSLLIGVSYGATSGFLGGRIDNLMMRIVDVLYSIPFIFVVIFLITIVNEYRTELEDNWGINREVVFYVVIGAIYWLTMARVVRGQVLSLRETEFVEAARVLAARVLEAEAKSDTERVNGLWRRAFSRTPTPAERSRLLRLLTAQRARFARAPEAATRLIGVGVAARAPALDTIEHAAWTQLARTILNLHGSIVRP